MTSKNTQHNKLRPALVIAAMVFLGTIAFAAFGYRLLLHWENEQRTLVLRQVEAIVSQRMPDLFADGRLTSQQMDRLEVKLQRSLDGKAFLKVDAGASSPKKTSWRFDPEAQNHQKTVEMGPHHLHMTVYWNGGLALVGDDALVDLTGLGFGIFLLMGAAVYGYYESYHLRPLHRKIARTQPYVALARGSQMLAHDVRKPFSMVRTLLATLRRQKTQEEVMNVINRAYPEISRVMDATDVMIQDIMEFGSEGRFEPEAVSLESLLDASLKETVSGNEDASLEFEYHFDHGHKLEVDPRKIQRVFSNILGNAIQAMQGQGRIWVESREAIVQGRAFIELCLGNSDTYIPEEEAQQLFTPFFTKGKKGGTGLGLAIVEKIVREHGGTVWASSEAEVGTEFWMRLPVCEGALNQTTVLLPLHSSELQAWNEQDRPGPNANAQETDTRDDSRARTLARLDERRDPLPLLVIEDDPFYRDYIASLVTSERDLQGRVEVQAPEDPAKLLHAPPTTTGIILCDVDLGEKAPSGLEFVEAFRKQDDSALICVHSNQTNPDLDLESRRRGADLVWLKPFTPEMLWTLLDRALGGTEAAPQAAPAEELPEIAVIDDDIFTREAWQMALDEEAKVHTFSSPEAFQSRAGEQPLLQRLDAVICDYYFGGDSELDGHDLARWIRQRSGIPIFVATNAREALARDEAVTAYIDKEPVTWANLQERISRLDTVS